MQSITQAISTVFLYSLVSVVYLANCFAQTDTDPDTESSTEEEAILEPQTPSLPACGVLVPTLESFDCSASDLVELSHSLDGQTIEFVNLESSTTTEEPRAKISCVLFLRLPVEPSTPIVADGPFTYHGQVSVTSGGRARFGNQQRLLGEQSDVVALAFDSGTQAAFAVSTAFDPEPQMSNEDVTLLRMSLSVTAKRSLDDNAQTIISLGKVVLPVFRGGPC